jgi:hypothetical protein
VAVITTLAENGQEKITFIGMHRMASIAQTLVWELCYARTAITPVIGVMFANIP